MYGMFFLFMCFWVVLLCSVFVQIKPIKPIKPKKPKNLKIYFKNLGFFPALTQTVRLPHVYLYKPMLRLDKTNLCSYLYIQH